MASGPRYSVKYRRRREGKTNYRSRLALVKSRKPRMVVRKTSTNIIVQFVTFAPEGDKVLGTALSRELRDLGWNYSTKSTPAAYLTGYLASKRVAGKVTEAVLDLGLAGPKKGSKVFAAMKGALDGGIKIPHGKDILPSEDRIKGKHIELYRQQPIVQEFTNMKAVIDKLKAGKIDKAPRPKGAKPAPRPVAPAPKPVAPAPKPVAQPPKPLPPPPPRPVAPAPKPVAQPPKPAPPPPKPVEKPVEKKPALDDMDALLAELTGKKTTPPPPKPAAPEPKAAEAPKTPPVSELLSKKKKEDEKKEP